MFMSMVVLSAVRMWCDFLFVSGFLIFLRGWALRNDWPRLMAWISVGQSVMIRNVDRQSISQPIYTRICQWWLLARRPCPILFPRYTNYLFIVCWWPTVKSENWNWEKNCVKNVFASLWHINNDFLFDLCWLWDLIPYKLMSSKHMLLIDGIFDGIYRFYFCHLNCDWFLYFWTNQYYLVLRLIACVARISFISPNRKYL